MSKTIDLVVRITVSVPDDTTPADHCAEAFEEGKPLLAVGDQLGEAIQDMMLGRDDCGFKLTLEPGREPGRPMTRQEVALWERGFHAGMALTLEACRDELGGDAFDSDNLTRGEELIAQFVGCEDLDAYDQDEAARALARFCRLRWNGHHWVSGIPGNVGARIDALKSDHPWEHNEPWGEES